jgi:RNA polymerase sigma-70 factor (ECF subfamily)
LNGTYQEKGFFAAWLFTIARRRLINHYRKPNLEFLHEALPFNPEISKQIEDQDQRHQLLKLINELDEDQQELLRLRFGSELTFEEMASLDGRNTAAVKMAIYRTLDQLRVRWEQKYGK